MFEIFLQKVSIFLETKYLDIFQKTLAHVIS